MNLGMALSRFELMNICRKWLCMHVDLSMNFVNLCNLTMNLKDFSEFRCVFQFSRYRIIGLDLGMNLMWVWI